MREMSISESFTYATIKISCITTGGDEISGTGFMFKFHEVNNRYIPALITNRHVIKGAEKGTLIVNVANSEGFPIDEKHIEFKIDKNFESEWVFHPDESVDLCALNMGATINDIKQKKKVNPYYTAFDKDMVMEYNSELLTAMEDVIMVGYPDGIWDEVNNKPLLRRGVTATHPDKDYNGKKEFLIDMAVYNGSSGSPVLVHNSVDPTYFGANKSLNPGIRKIILLGILSSGFVSNVEGEVLEVPSSHKKNIKTEIPINLGIVIKAKRILELEKELLARLD